MKLENIKLGEYIVISSDDYECGSWCIVGKVAKVDIKYDNNRNFQTANITFTLAAEYHTERLKLVGIASNRTIYNITTHDDVKFASGEWMARFLEEVCNLSKDIRKFEESLS